ncbi:MAG TPA: hypothetical protein DCP11_12280 [Microbacteriaceae bacterium]|jgi:cell wall-associated NlpC family hydrolase|nr:hypothetical protein [Microbacteriaceae bacterium]
MSSIVAKFGAIAAAGALIATTAIPAYASLGSPTEVRQQTSAVQTLAVDATVALAAPARDAYAVSMPVPVAAVRPKAAPITVNRYTGVAPPAQSYSGAALIQYAAQFVGVVPYGSGNSPTTSFSCDGYTQYVFAGFGISLPRGADHQARLGVRVDQSAAVAGDLVYWPGQHVGIYDGAGGMYNSPTWGRYVEHVSSLWGSPLFIRLQV